MLKKYFEININNPTTAFCSEFELLQESNEQLIAQDVFGNKILVINNCIFLYIHDAPLDSEYIKLFDNTESFYQNIIFYDEEEKEQKYNNLTNQSTPDEKDYIPDKKILISTFIKKLSSDRLQTKYKQGSYYDIKNAYLDGNITKDEFEIFRFLPE